MAESWERLYEGRQNQEPDRRGAWPPGERPRRPALQAEVSDEHGPDRELEEDAWPAQGYRPGEDADGRAPARDRDGETINGGNNREGRAGPAQGSGGRSCRQPHAEDDRG